MALKIIFVGTPDFAVPSLKAIAQSSHHICLVITQPDRPKGRGKKLAEPPVKLMGKELGIEAFQPDSINTDASLNKIRKFNPDVIAVVAFGQKLSQAVLDVSCFGAFNLHASLLPSYRGAAPITYAIWKGETETGLSIFRMAQKMDAGEIGLQTTTPIKPHETAGELHDRLANLGASLFVKFLDDLEANRIQFTPQDPSKITFAPSLKKNQGRIDWSLSAEEICRLIRAMTPWPSAFTFRRSTTGEERLIVLKATSNEQSTSATAGTITEINEHFFVIAAGKGSVKVLRLQPAGKRAMDAAEYIRGHTMNIGEFFS